MSGRNHHPSHPAREFRTNPPEREASVLIKFVVGVVVVGVVVVGVAAAASAVRPAPVHALSTPSIRSSTSM